MEKKRRGGDGDVACHESAEAKNNDIASAKAEDFSSAVVVYTPFIIYACEEEEFGLRN